MTRNAGKRYGVGALNTIPRSGCRPVATVRMQKTEIKYKKPTGQDCAEDHPFRSVGRNRLTRYRIRRSLGVWRSRDRTPTLALGVGGRLFPGSSARADRPLSHSQIFFPQLNVFSALPRSKSSRAFDCKHLRRRMSANALQMKGDLRCRSALVSLARKTPSRMMPESSIYFLGPRYRGGRSNFGRRGIGPFMPHFFTQNFGNIFFKEPLRRNAIEKSRPKS